MAIHNNSMVSLQMQNLHCKQKTYFFKSKSEIFIKSFLVENNHCYHSEIMQKLKLIIAKKREKILEQNIEIVNRQDISRDTFGDKLAEDIHDEISHIKREARNASVIELAEPFIGVEKCYDCMSKDSKCRRIILNSLNAMNSNNSNDIEITIKTKSKELERIHIDEIVHFNVSVLINDIFLYVEPNILSNIVKILLEATEFANEYKSNHDEFMQEKGFLPLINKKVDQILESEIEKEQEYKSAMDLTIESITMLCFYHQEPLYLLNLKHISIFSNNFPSHYVCKMTTKDMELLNISTVSGEYPHVLKPLDENFSFTFEFKIFNSTFSSIKKYSTYMGLRIKSCEIVFLKRNVSEIVEYFRNKLLNSFYSQPQQPLQETTNQEPSTFRLEILVLDSEIIAPRNSISRESFTLKFDKLALWSTGAWGIEPSNLIDEAIFEWEKNAESFYSAVASPEDEFQEAKEESMNSELFGEKRLQNKRFIEYYSLMIQGLTGYNTDFYNTESDREKETGVFLKTDRDSLTLNIFFEDESYKDEQIIPPMKS